MHALAACPCPPQEVRQSFGDWASLTTRLYSGSDNMDVVWTVGPIMKDDGVGREVVVRWSSNLTSGGCLLMAPLACLAGCVLPCVTARKQTSWCIQLPACLPACLASVHCVQLPSHARSTPACAGMLEAPHVH